MEIEFHQSEKDKCSPPGWGPVLDRLAWLPGGNLNTAHEAIDRHLRGRNRNKVALIWEGLDQELEIYTFQQVKTESDRFANVLSSLGVSKGDRILLYLDRIPELYFTFLGALKIGAVAGILCPESDAKTVRDHMSMSSAKILVTQPLFRHRLGEIIYELFELQHIVVVNKNGKDPVPTDIADLNYEEEMAKAPTEFQIVPTNQLEDATIQFTAGTSEDSNAVVHQHQAVVQQYETSQSVLDLKPEDIYWFSIDPGSVANIAYGIVGPWANGVTQLAIEGSWNANRCYELLTKHRVTVWVTTPTALNELMETGPVLEPDTKLPDLRHVFSTGTHLPAETIQWGFRALGSLVRDCYIETESGAFICANYPGIEVRAGSIGKPTTGIELAILDHSFERLEPGMAGYLAIRPGWPSMFVRYWDNDNLYKDHFRRGWYITGDRAKIDEDGYFWMINPVESRAKSSEKDNLYCDTRSGEQVRPYDLNL